MGEEVWRPVVGYEGLYSVSNMGRVRSERNRTNSKKGAMLRGNVAGGYWRVRLYGGGTKHHAMVHRLVAAAFFGNNPDMVVNHLNGDKHDNRLENLWYATRSENSRHAVDVLGRNRGENARRSVLTDAAVREILSDRRASAKGLADKYNVCVATVYAVRQGKNWRHINVVD